MSASTPEISNDRQPPARNAATAVIDNVDYCRFVTVAPFPPQPSPARHAPVPLYSGPAHIAHLPAAIRRPFGDDAPHHHGSLPAAPSTSTPSHADHRCCACSRRATCSLTKLKGKAPACACKLANRSCTSCACLSHCKNTRAILPLVSPAPLLLVTGRATRPIIPAAPASVTHHSPVVPPSDNSQPSPTTLHQAARAPHDCVITECTGTSLPTQIPTTRTATTPAPFRPHNPYLRQPCPQPIPSPATTHPIRLPSLPSTPPPPHPPPDLMHSPTHTNNSAPSSRPAPPSPPDSDDDTTIPGPLSLPDSSDADSIDDPHSTPDPHPPPAAAPHPPIPPLPPTFTPDIGADLPTYVPTEADNLLRNAYGDHVHDNDGTHLSADIVDDPLWQHLWLRIVQLHYLVASCHLYTRTSRSAGTPLEFRTPPRLCCCNSAIDSGSSPLQRYPTPPHSAVGSLGAWPLQGLSE